MKTIVPLFVTIENKNLRFYSSNIDSKKESIISKYDKGKYKYNYFIFNYNNFNKNYLVEVLMIHLRLNETYSILFKFGFKGNIFYMSGRQIGVILKDFHNVRYYKEIYRILENRFIDLIEQYKIKSLPNSISFMYKILEPLPELSLKNIKSVSLNKNIFSIVETNNLFSSKYLPLTTDISYFGVLLEGIIKNKYIKKLIKVISMSNTKIPEFLFKIDLDKNVKIFLSKKSLGNKKDSKQNKIYLIIRRLDNLQLNKDSLVNKFYINTVFDLSTGIILLEAIDIVKSENYFRREIKDKNISISFKNNRITEITQKIKFNIVNYINSDFTYKGRSNPNFGVLDVETYKESDNISKIYALGFVTLLEKDKINIFYLTDLVLSLDSNLLVIICIDSMLIAKYHNYNFYVHNLGLFDVVFLHKILKEFNLHYKKDKYLLKSIFRDGVMLKLSVSIKISNNKYIKINFIDSINILNSSLNSLSKSFKVNTLKGVFPYKFVTKDNLNYVGRIPDIKYYNKGKISIEEYKEISKDNWDLRKEATY